MGQTLKHFNFTNTSAVPQNDKSAAEPAMSNDSSMQQLADVSSNNSTVDSAVSMASFVTKDDVSCNSASGINDMFACMFPDSEVATSFS